MGRRWMLARRLGLVLGGSGCEMDWRARRTDARAAPFDRCGRCLSALASLTLLGLAPAAHAVPTLAAGLHSVIQKNQAFGVAELTVPVGDTVMFGNADDVSHNITVKSADGSVDDLGAQKPGLILKKTFDKAGVYRVLCQIHPKMKMTIVAAN